MDERCDFELAITVIRDTAASAYSLAEKGLISEHDAEIVLKTCRAILTEIQDKLEAFRATMGTIPQNWRNN